MSEREVEPKPFISRHLASGITLHFSGQQVVTWLRRQPKGVQIEHLTAEPHPTREPWTPDPRRDMPQGCRRVPRAPSLDDYDLR